MHSEYVPLHLHTEYSLLDGGIKIDDLIAKAKEFNLAALAITDHGNLFGAIEFYKKVSKAGLKPIIGCEVYIAPKSRFDKGASNEASESSFHLILLCKDMNGYKNLSRLISKAYLEGFYYKPRIDKDILSQYSGGLIGLSSCLKGEIPRYLASGQIDKARNAALEYRKVLGSDNFYLEIQSNELPEQDEVNKQLIELGNDLHIPLVATNDCHYLNRSDAKAHEVLLCIQTGKTMNDTDRMKFSKDTFYFKSPQEMKDAFKAVPEAIENSKRIAEKCNLDFKFNEFKLPRFTVPEGEKVKSYLQKLAENGLNKKLHGSIPGHYSERLDSELAMIEKMGFSSYFLIVWDFISYAKSKDIPVGPGRGSAAGSLVAYSLDITDIDPIKYGLLFERFLNPERVSMPDIDVDFCMDRRSEVIDYVSARYGKDHVAQIITFGTMQARAAIRDVGRALNIPYSEVDKVAKLVPMVAKINLRTAIGMEPKLKELYQSKPEIKELIDIAQILEGLSRHASTHAAGIVISPEPLTEFLPLFKSPNEEAITTQFDMNAIKDLGLLKFDFLGLKTLTIIDTAEKIINRPHHEAVTPLNPPSEGEDLTKRFSIRNIPLDDTATYEILSSGKTAGIFQLESSGMRDLLTRLRPDVFEDLIALVALYRPGPLGSGMVDEFIQGKNSSKSPGEKKTTGSIAKLNIPKLNDILKETHGIILYQEQVMEIAHKLANFSLAQADILRKAMGGKNPEEMEKMKNIFIEGLKGNTVSEKKAEMLYNLVLQFAQYGFNKSHSAAYALIAYQTAYLKAHYPVEFMAALLSADMDNTAKVVMYIGECKEMGIDVLPPDINESTREFKVIGKSIRFGLEAVKGVGSAAIDSIIEARNSKSLDSFFDFCSRMDSRRVNKKVIESLIKAGALDSLGKRSQLMFNLPAIMDAAMRFQKESDSGQESMFGIMSQPASPRLTDVDEWDESKRLMMEKEALGFYITGHPLNRYREKFTELSIIPTHELLEMEEKRDVNIGGLVRDLKQIQTKNKGDLMAYITLEDQYGTVEVIVFPDVYRESQNIITQDTPIIISGNTDKTDKGMKVIAKRIFSVDENDLNKELKTGGNSQNRNKRRETGASSGPQNLSSSQYKSLVLTMRNTARPETLPELNEVFSRYTGDCPVYLKIVSPRNWETLLKTERHVSPSKELISEMENILGEGTTTLN